jgi:translation initiation factor 1
MSKKKNNFSGGLVYSTNPNFKLEEVPEENLETVAPEQQRMVVRLDSKNRSGKVVTLIEGFVGMEDDRQELGKKLKSFCGTGGSVKDGEIIVQGDNRDKVLQWLNKNGFVNVKKK